MIKSALVWVSLVSILFLSGCSSSNEDFLKSKLSKDDMEIISLNIEDEKEGELLGQKLMSVDVTVTYKTLGYTCEYEKFSFVGLRKGTMITQTEEECLQPNRDLRNQHVTAQPGKEVVDTKTIVYSMAELDKWEDS